MPLDWFDVRKASAVGAALADQLAQQALSGVETSSKQPLQSNKMVQELFRHTDSALQSLHLNIFKRAKLANSFKWRLLERGIDKQIADDVTQALVVRLMSGAAPAKTDDAAAVRAAAVSAKDLLANGNSCFERGEYAEAIAFYEQMLELKPRSADAHNNLGAVLFKLERFAEADQCFRTAIKLRPDYPEALSNLGAVQQWAGYYEDAESSLRRALKLNPRYVDARSLLGRALLLQGRVKEAKTHFSKALAIDPKDMEALIGMGEATSMEGQFQEAEEWLMRALAVEPNPRAPSALATIARLRRMTAADKPWLERAMKLAQSKLPVTEEAALRFAIGKYYDDLGDYARAFPSFKRANELVHSLSPIYSREAREQFVDELIRTYSRELVSVSGAGASDSAKPVFVVGMPRSGTTLVEQIISSHPQAHGAGELGFWNTAGRRRDAQIREGAPLTEPIRRELARGYLKLLDEHAPKALRVVDKAPLNADFLGLIHSVFPQARIIHVQRSAIDTCLSCYFQPFSQLINFSTDLADLAHYYRQHHRLMAHWRSVLPKETLLEISYESLVADQASGSRRLLDFIGLAWDDRCLEFHKTERGVITASSWQVRQKMYSSSVERWRHYEKFVGPLLTLKDLDA